MKRDMDLARQILREVEDSDADGSEVYVFVEVAGRSRREVEYHIRLLEEVGLLATDEVIDRDDLGKMGMRLIVSRLTSEGHDFLDAARDEGLWKTAKEQIKAKAGVVSFEILKQLLGQLATSAVLGP